MVFGWVTLFTEGLSDIGRKSRARCAEITDAVKNETCFYVTQASWLCFRYEQIESVRSSRSDNVAWLEAPSVNRYRHSSLS
jgi:hypothetical protein